MKSQPLEITPTALSPDDSEWFRWCTPNPRAQVRLFCFPHAGCGASVFRGWNQELPDTIELRACQLPGRENLGRWPAFTELSALIATLLPVLTPYLDRPFAFYGQSMGALVGFELARQLRRAGLPEPLCLLVASRRAPQLPTPMRGDHQFSEAALLAWVRRVGGTPESLLTHPKWREYYLSILRADLTVTERYVYEDEPPLSCPLFAYWGSHDTVVTRDQLSSWQEQTRSRFALEVLPGGHIFDPQTATNQFASIVAHLTACLPTISNG